MKRKIWKMSLSDAIYSVIVAIIAAFAVAVVTYPLIYVISASVSDPMDVVNGNVVFWPKNVSLEAYRKVVTNNNMLIGIRNTVYYSVLGTAINLVLTVMAAYALSKKDMKGRDFFTIMITFTMFFSGGMIPTYLNLKDLDLLNTTWALVLPGAIGATNMLIVRNYFMNSIPGELCDAAEIDGCSLLSTLVKIILPLSKPIIAVIFIYYFAGHWNSYFSALLYIMDRDKYPLQVFLREILLINQMSTLGETNALGDTAAQNLLYESMKYAVIILSSLPIVAIYPFIQKFFAKGIMIGSIKG